MTEGSGASVAESLDAGDIDAAVRQLSARLKSTPADLASRIALFEVLGFAGDLDRAAKQLEAVATQHGGGAMLSISIYRSILQAERVRLDVFRGASLPGFLVAPPPSVEPWLLLLKRQHVTPADVAQLSENLPALRGEVNGTPFRSIRDVDDRLAPVLEAFCDGEYLWLPFEQIRQLTILDPVHLRDLLWTPATVHMEGREETPVYLPTLYPNTHRSPSGGVRLGRETEWEVSGGLTTGRGQRLLMVDEQDLGVLEVRTLSVEPVGLPA